MTHHPYSHLTGHTQTFLPWLKTKKTTDCSPKRATWKTNMFGLIAFAIVDDSLLEKNGISEHVDLMNT